MGFVGWFCCLGGFEFPKKLEKSSIFAPGCGCGWPGLGWLAVVGFPTGFLGKLLLTGALLGL